jgi:hypothetical protein
MFISSSRQMSVSLEELKAHNLGKQVSKLRKHLNQQVSEAAKAVVAKWKKEVWLRVYCSDSLIVRAQVVAVTKDTTPGTTIHAQSATKPDGVLGAVLLKN